MSFDRGILHSEDVRNGAALGHLLHSPGLPRYAFANAIASRTI